jgi:hypothetical protein
VGGLQLGGAVVFPSPPPPPPPRPRQIMAPQIDLLCA